MVTSDHKVARGTWVIEPLTIIGHIVGTSDVPVARLICRGEVGG
jgi:hypothetical protein